MAELAYAIALGAIGVTLGGSNPLPPIVIFDKKNYNSTKTSVNGMTSAVASVVPLYIYYIVANMRE